MGGRVRPAGLPGLSTLIPQSGWSGRCRGQVTAATMARHRYSHRQPVGRCSVSRRAELAIRAGRLINWSRMVAGRAVAWNAEARQLAPRVRLCAIAARVSQAALAANLPNWQLGQRPRLQVGDDVFDDGVAAVQVSACSMVNGESVNTAW